MSRGRDPGPEEEGRRPIALDAALRARRPEPPSPAPDFAELVAATNYSFLRGASHPADMVAQALALGHAGIGIADRNTVAGVVRAWSALKSVRKMLAEDAEDQGIRTGETVQSATERRHLAAQALPLAQAFRLVTGARLCFADGTPDIIAYPINRHGWGRLTRLLSVGNLKSMVQKGDCDLRLSDLIEHAQDMVLIVMAGEADEALLARLAQLVPDGLWIGVTMPRVGPDRRRLARLAAMALRLGLPLLATCDALYAVAQDRPLHDVVTCIRQGVTLREAGRRLEANAERHLKPAREMARLFRDWPQAVGAWRDVLDRIAFDLSDLKYEYPHEPVPEGWEAQDWLEHEVLRLAGEAYPDGVPDKVHAMLAEEFALIRTRNYACYFLTVYEAVQFARSLDPPILCQGRGSAANSAVCYYLGITSVDPTKHNLLFSRFISEDRDEPPDIDVDFEHERREEVIQHIYARYGRERAAIAATVIHYRPRSTVREVGKVLGLSEDVTARIGSTVWGSHASGMEERRFRDAGLDVGNPLVMQLKELVDRLLTFPRHLSQHVGGFVLTQDRLDETVPIHHAAMADRTFLEWDKDDIDALGLMKVDVLALGMLSCIRKGFALMRDHRLGDMTLASVPGEEVPVYDMLCRGDSVGVFQVESRAQINMLPRLRPRTFYDLAVQVAIVRPGPIEGDMVHPYLARRAEARDGKPPSWRFPSPAPPHPADELHHVLGHTYGVPLFQEQAMKLAITAASFTSGEANKLRRAMATFRNVGTIGEFEEKMIGGMVARGYERAFAQRCYDQIKGFGSYGFPESHAISFARLVYVSAWLKCYQPAVFAAALLNAQPMGFYAPAQIVRDAIEHGVMVRGIDVNASGWDNGLEPIAVDDPDAGKRWTPANRRWGDIVPRHRQDGAFALRLGFRQIDGFREAWGEAIAADRATSGPFASIEELGQRVRLPARALHLLADADACRSIGRARRDAAWDVRRMPSGELPLFAAARARELGEEADAALPPMPLSEAVAADYQLTRLSLKQHPMTFLRPVFRAEGLLTSEQVSGVKNGVRAKVAGVVLVRQRPGKGNAIFATLEDETGIVNILLWARMLDRYRLPLMAARLMEAHGVVQRVREGPVDVLHLMADRIVDRTAELDRLSEDHATLIEAGPGDKAVHPVMSRLRSHGHPRNVRILPGSRDFH
ncbi:DNA polymerase III alpha subunit [Sphingobium indicum BiD32]|uniref:Error-prone DNA polymerase n=1 Tax=Sphingobium indicum BiD32 TaxID=1301087 RepID=N1MQA6_9SPHN|nr:error-prone DNA polymerase [Sphingobium indicum]CCW18924.1 DNA polymerase III alpha subunit [Sphingobium indicum BiD32]